MDGVVPPVGDDEAFEAPFVAEDAGEKFAVLGGALLVDEVVGGHDGKGPGDFDADLEGFEVELTEGADGDLGVGILPVLFFVVAGKMLERAADALALGTLDEGGGEHAGEEGILGEVLEVAAAEGRAVEVDGRPEPEADAIFTDFLADGLADLLEETHVPGAGEEGSGGEGSGRNGRFGAETEALGTIGGHHVGNAGEGKIPDAEGVRDAAVGLPA